MSNAALLLIDVQKGFDDPSWGIRNNPEAEKKIESLLFAWRNHEWPIVHIQHCSRDPESPLSPDRPGCEFREQTKPVGDEKQFTKTVNSAFIGTALETHLRDNNIHSLVVVGLTTDHCVSTSVRMAGNLGFDVTLVSDATATFDRQGVSGVHYSADEIHAIHLASLNGEFCTVSTTDEVLNNLS